jgi:hypothetical protein
MSQQPDPKPCCHRKKVSKPNERVASIGIEDFLFKTGEKKHSITTFLFKTIKKKWKEEEEEDVDYSRGVIGNILVFNLRL